MAVSDEDLAVLVTARSNVIRLIAEVTSEPKPNYNIDGQKIDWASYLEQLQKSLRTLDAQIADYDEPWEIESVMYT